MVFRAYLTLMLLLAIIPGCNASIRPIAVLSKSTPISSFSDDRLFDSDIGSPAKTGSHTSDARSLTVVGAGTGDRKVGGDQLHYTYFLQKNGGDVDIRARLTSFVGLDHARAGIMLRSSNDANSTTANIELALRDAVDGNNNVFTDAHDETRGTGNYYGVGTRMRLPIWLRLVRIGNDFAVYKSPDGHIWSCLGNGSGWQFKATGPIEVGFFVASGNSNVTASATFDNILTGMPSVGYESSWFGNTFGGRVSDGHVSLTIKSLWTSPDGSCYTNTDWDEAGRGANLYKEGKVVTEYAEKNWMLGNNRCAEGSITGDGKNLYLLGFGHEGTVLLKTDKLARTSATVPMFLSIDPYGQIGKEKVNIISGLAVSKNQLYISDARDNLVRVAKTSIPIYQNDINSTVNTTSHSIATDGILNAAPELVYQSQRANDSLAYTIPNLRPNAPYTVRCHFAEYKETETGRRLIDVYVTGASPVKGYDVVAKSGGPFKAAVLEVRDGRADAVGKIHLVLVRGVGGDGQATICGFEVLNKDGEKAFALNCGGPVVGSFQTETYDLPQRSFSFQRPGPMVADMRGDLWIIREANDFPVGTTVTTKYPGAILCYHPDGTFSGREIKDVDNPTAIAYDRVRDRLLIADNGSNQNIRFYEHISSKPILSGTFGKPGGIYASGSASGVPSGSNGVRLYGLIGVGIDNRENIYVACGMQGTDVRAYTEEGRLLWMVNGSQFCSTPGLDPDSDATIAYNAYYRASLNYSSHTPGKEWSYLGYAWNPFKYGDPPRLAAAQTIVRRLGKNRSVILYTSGQGGIDHIDIFRVSGNMIVPCGQIRRNGTQIWIDKKGDGKETVEDVETVALPGYLSRFHVDAQGDLWLALLNRNSAFIRHLRLLGLNSIGAPVYDLKPGDYEDIPYPGTRPPINTQGQEANAIYDSSLDTMYLLGPAAGRSDNHQDVLSYLARYDHWKSGNRTPRWEIQLPDPETDYNFPYETSDPYGLGYEWMGMDLAVDKLFIAGMWGNVDVFNTADGTLDRVIAPGPELEGSCGWEDAVMGLTAYKRKDGEYVVFTENAAFNAKCNLFRISPGK